MAIKGGWILTIVLSTTAGAVDASICRRVRCRLRLRGFLEFHLGLQALVLPVILAVIAVLLGELLSEDPAKFEQQPLPGASNKTNYISNWNFSRTRENQTLLLYDGAAIPEGVVLSAIVKRCFVMSSEIETSLILLFLRMRDSSTLLGMTKGVIPASRWSG